VTWTSSNPDVAIITASGLATGVSKGTVTITAASNGVTDKATLTVAEAPIQPTVDVNISMEPAYRTAGKNVFVWAIATVSVGIDGATVEGHWEKPAYSTVSGTTDASGSVSLQSKSGWHLPAPVIRSIL
jgi:Flp pilus assembly protein TadG